MVGCSRSYGSTSNPDHGANDPAWRPIRLSAQWPHSPRRRRRVDCQRPRRRSRTPRAALQRLIDPDGDDEMEPEPVSGGYFAGSSEVAGGSQDKSTIGLIPQQVIVLSVRIPQLCHCPALTFLKIPVGASVCPPWLEPQQVIVSSVRIPQLWLLPALTVLKSPVGASVCPSPLYPQQVIVLSVLNPQLCPLPALTVLKFPAAD